MLYVIVWGKYSPSLKSKSMSSINNKDVDVIYNVVWFIN